MSKKYSIAIKFSVMLVVLGVLIVMIDPRKIVSALSGIDRLTFFSAVLLLIPNLSLQFLKWGYLLRRDKPDVSLKEIVGSTLVGFSFGLVSPGRLGEVARGLCIKGQNRLKMVGLAAVDKIYHVATIVIAGMVSLALLKPPVIRLIACGVIGVVLWECSNNLNLLKRILAKASSVLPFAQKISPMIEGFETLSRKRSLIVLSLSALFYAIYFTQFYFLVLSFTDFPFRTAVMTIPLVFLIKIALPITPIDIGVREATAVLLFSQFGVEKACAFNAAFLLFLINVLVPGLIGTFLIPSIRLRG